MIRSTAMGHARFSWITPALAVTAVVLSLLSLGVGRYHIPLEDVLTYLTGGTISDTAANVIGKLRVPRTLLALLIGAALALSGALYQSAFNNNLVSPDLLGVSSGAGAGACVAILLGCGTMMVCMGSFALGLAAVGLAVGIALLLGQRSKLVLILSGIAVGGLMSSLIGLMKFMADNEMKLAEMTYWLLGDISGATMQEVLVMMPLVAICSLIALKFAWRVNIVSLGRRESRSLGVDYGVTMGLVIIIATILTAAAVSMSGTIGWIGLVIPNLVRLLMGSDNRHVLPTSILLGACFLLITDMMARSLSPDEIPLSIITGLIGTPIFVAVLICRRSNLQ